MGVCVCLSFFLSLMYAYLYDTCATMYVYASSRYASTSVSVGFVIHCTTELDSMLLSRHFLS